DDVDLPVSAVMGFEHVVMAGGLSIHRDEAVGAVVLAQMADDDRDLAVGEAGAYLGGDVLVAGIEVPGLELADRLDVLQPLQAAVQGFEVQRRSGHNGSSHRALARKLAKFQELTAWISPTPRKPRPFAPSSNPSWTSM